MTVAATEDVHRRGLVLGICCISLFVVGVDITAVNVALPDIRQSLNAGVDGLQWIVDAYTVALAGLLMFAGSMADRFGRRRTFQLGLAVFALASLACALAPTIGWLIAFRAVQGVGGSMLNPVAMSIIRAVFTRDAERARALGVWAAAFGLAMGAGPLIGGLLLGAGLTWRSIFWINVPLGLAGLVLTALFVPESRAARPRRIDPVGQVSVIVLLGALTFAVIDGPRDGWGSVPVVAGFGVAAAALAVSVVHRPRHAEPLLNPRLFRSAPFSGAALACCLGFAAFGGFLWVNTLYLQDVRGYTALHAGLVSAPMAAMTLLFGPVSGRLVARYGARPSLLVAGVGMTVGAAMLVGLTPTTSTARLLAAYTVFGIGFAMLSAPTNATALTALPAGQSGTAAGITSTSRQVGQVLGVAVVGSVLAARLHGPLRSGLTAAGHPVWWITAALGLAVLVLGLVITGRWALRTATSAREPDEPD